MTELEKQQAFAELNYRIAVQLTEIEEMCHEQGLTRLVRFSLIARDPGNDEMCLVITNDDVKEAARVALNHASTVVA